MILSEAGGGRLASGQRVELAGDEHQPDPGQHALDDGTEMARNQRPSFRAPMASWSSPAASTITPSARQPELLDRLEDQHGQTGGRAGHLEAAARQQSGDEAADDAGDQAEFGRHTGGDGHAHAQRQGDQEDDEGRGEVGPEGFGAQIRSNLLARGGRRGPI